MNAIREDLLSSEEAGRLRHLRQMLDETGVDYDILSHHETIVSAEEGAARGIGSLAEMAPTLILETEKGLMAAIICGQNRLSYRKIKKQLGLKNVALARSNVVLHATGAQVGTVSLINQDIQTIVAG